MQVRRDDCAVQSVERRHGVRAERPPRHRHERRGDQRGAEQRGEGRSEPAPLRVREVYLAPEQPTRL